MICKTHLPNIELRIAIKFVVADCNNDDILKAVKGISNAAKEELQSLSQVFDIGLNRIKHDRDVDVVFIDFYVSISYFAIDYKEQTNSSFIQAKHYLLNENKKSIKVFYCTVRPGTNLYDYYKEQILILDRIKEKAVSK